MALFVPLLGCTTLGYVTQAASGQYELLARARDIDEVVREKRVDERKRQLLSMVADVKRYGERRGLRPTNNYTKYVRIDRPAVVWVASASEPLRFRSKTWRFPVVGAFTYLGWFRLIDATEFVGRLQEEGWDADVRPSRAYSTTGFFEDAVLSTMIPSGGAAAGELANTLLHESTHATVFVRNQSTLNESIANFVGDRLAEGFLAEQFGPDAPEMHAYLEAERTSHERGRALREAYEHLDALYRSSKTEGVKLAEKQAYLDGLRRQLSFRRPINNATLIQYRTYHSGEAALGNLLGVCENDWPRFLGVLRKLEGMKLPQAQEQDVGRLLLPLLAARCVL